jgi:RNA polymerase sigma factor (sigma-70 family)
MLRLRNDEQLVELFRGGSDAAFGVLHDRYRARLFAYIRHVLARRPAADIEDVLQDTFERAHTALRFGRQTPDVVRVWLYRVARNRCIDELRRQPPAEADVHAMSRVPRNDTDAVAERRALVAQLVCDLQELPEQQRSALLLREINGLSHAELAETLDVSVSAVKSLLVRARTSLVRADEARDVACETIRPQIAASHDRGVKLCAQAQRHLRECPSCRAYRADLRGLERTFRALTPGLPWIASLGLLGRGTSIGSKTGGGAAAAAGPAISAAKLATLVCAAAVVTAGGVARTIGLPGTSHTPTAPVTAHHARVSGSVAALSRTHARAVTLAIPANAPSAAQAPPPGAAAPVVQGAADQPGPGTHASPISTTRALSTAPAPTPIAVPSASAVAGQVQSGTSSAGALAQSTIGAGDRIAKATLQALTSSSAAKQVQSQAQAGVPPLPAVPHTDLPSVPHPDLSTPPSLGLPKTGLLGR